MPPLTHYTEANDRLNSGLMETEASLAIVVALLAVCDELSKISAVLVDLERTARSRR